MKIFIPSYMRSTTLTTPFLLDACGWRDYLIVLKNDREYRDYCQNSKLRRSTLIVLPQDKPLNAAREYVRSLVEPGAWCLQLDDNIRYFSACEPDLYRTVTELPENPTRSEYGHVFNRKVEFAEFYELVITDCIQEAERRGANIVAFAPLENPFFRRRKWRDLGYTSNKAVLLRKTRLKWDQSENHPAMEEYALCAAQHLEYGRVLIANWAHPRAGHYEGGGLGPYEERLPGKIAACQNIMRRWPGLFRPGSKKHLNNEGELRVRFNNLEQVEKWRAAMKAAGRDPNYRDPLAVSPAA